MNRPASVSGHRPRKRFGQHFLSDQSVLQALVASLNLSSADRVVEIGPGLGALTDVLLRELTTLTVVELDRDLAARLRERYARASKTVQIIEADALRVDWTQLLAGDAQGVRLVGNLPYNISSPLLVSLIDYRALIVDQHFMLQREVVQRIAAVDGPHYGRLGILLQAFYACESVLDVPASAFSPPPRVESAVVRMTVRQQALVPDAKVLSELLAAAFSQRRKMIRKTLLPWLQDRGVQPGLTPGCPPLPDDVRPETLPPATYYALASLLRPDTA